MDNCEKLDLYFNGKRACRERRNLLFFFFITKGIFMLLDFHFNEESSLGSAISDLKVIPVLG